jgi:hypothetical protein
MTIMARNNYPAFNGAAYTLMKAMHGRKPMSTLQLIEASGFIGASAKVALTLQSWIEKGWVLNNGYWSLTPFAQNYFGGGEDKPKFVGIPATSCTFNMLTRPPYKSPRTYRREGPEWAQRPSGFGFKSAMGAKEVGL